MFFLSLTHLMNFYNENLSCDICLCIPCYVPIYSTHNLSLITTVPLDELFFNILKVGGAELINQIRMDPFTF